MHAGFSTEDRSRLLAESLKRQVHVIIGWSADSDEIEASSRRVFDQAQLDRLVPPSVAHRIDLVLGSIKGGRINIAQGNVMAEGSQCIRQMVAN